MKFREWLEQSEKKIPTVPGHYPPNAYGYQYPDLYFMSKAADNFLYISLLPDKDEKLVVVGDAFEGKWTSRPTWFQDYDKSDHEHVYHPKIGLNYPKSLN
jgi:hypothetical protein